MIVWIKEQLRPPIFEDEDKTRTAAQLNIILWTTFISMLLAAPIIILSSTSAMAMGISAGLVGGILATVIGMLILLRRARVRLSTLLFLSVMLVILTAAVGIFGGVRSTTTPAFLLIILVAGLLLGWRAALGFGALTVLVVGGIFLVERGLETVVVPMPPLPDYDDFFILLVIFSVATAFIVFIRRNINTAFERIEENEQKLREANQELRESRDALSARTDELEHRSQQLHAVTTISRQVATAQSLDDMLQQTADLVRLHYELGEVRVYLKDEGDDVAVLRAIAGGPAGRTIAELHTSLRLDGGSRVARVIDSGQLYVGREDRADQPWSMAWEATMQEEGSRAILPLQMKGEVMGAVELSSPSGEPLSEEDVLVLQTLADQLAAMIDNARLFGEMRRTMQELEVASGQYTRESWLSAVQAGRGVRGYRYRRYAVEPEEEPPPESQRAISEGRTVIQPAASDAVEDQAGEATVIAVPVRLRDEVLAVMNLHLIGEKPSPEEVDLVEEISDRLALALENTRLLEETRRRVEREQVIGELSARMRESLDMDTVLQTAVQEMAETLNITEVEVRMSDEMTDEE